MSSLEISAKTSLVSCQSTNNGVAIIKGCEPQHLLQLSVLDFPLMLWVNWPVDNRIRPLSKKFAMGVENKVKVTQDLQCTGNDSPGRYKVLLKKGKTKLLVIMH